MSIREEMLHWMHYINKRTPKQHALNPFENVSKRLECINSTLAFSLPLQVGANHVNRKHFFFYDLPSMHSSRTNSLAETHVYVHGMVALRDPEKRSNFPLIVLFFCFFLCATEPSLSGKPFVSVCGHRYW